MLSARERMSVGGDGDGDGRAGASFNQIQKMLINALYTSAEKKTKREKYNHAALQLQRKKKTSLKVFQILLSLRK